MKIRLIRYKLNPLKVNEKNEKKDMGCCLSVINGTGSEPQPVPKPSGSHSICGTIHPDGSALHAFHAQGSDRFE